MKLLRLDTASFCHPLTGQFMPLESETCRSLLGEECVRKMKRLVSRITVKSYIISINNNPPSSSSAPPHPLRSASLNNPNPMQPPCKTSTTNNKATNLVKETRSYILDFVVVPDTGSLNTRRITIQEAKRRGILNLEQGLYVDTFKNITISIDEAIKCSLIGARMAICEKNFVIEENSNSNNSGGLITTAITTNPTTTESNTPSLQNLGLGNKCLRIIQIFEKKN